MNETTSLGCQIHKYHSPIPKLNHVHYVMPLGWGGRGDWTNKIVVCPTGHANVHILLEAWQNGMGMPSWNLLKKFGPAERALAQRGFNEWVVGDA